MVNPGSNPNQVGKIRLSNSSTFPTSALIFGYDDQGVTFGAVLVDLVAGGSLTLSVAELEQGSSNPAVTGALGNGSGKWRFDILSDSAIGVMSLIFSPGGYLSNVTSTGNYTFSEGGRFPITCETLDGAVIMSGSVRPIFLGFIGSVSGTDSIFNTIGDYGSNVSSTSIFNPFSQWGSPTSALSAFNENSTSAPYIVKQGRVLSFLTTNPTSIAIGVGISATTIQNACSPLTSVTAKDIYNPRDFGLEPSGVYTNGGIGVDPLSKSIIAPITSGDPKPRNLQQELWLSRPTR